MSEKWVDWVPMGNSYAPINSTTPNRASGAARATLTTGAAQTITFDAAARTLTFVCSWSVTSPIFIKFWQQSGQVDASATVFDEVLTPWQPVVQLWIMTFCNSFSIFSSATQTVYLIER